MKDNDILLYGGIAIAAWYFLFKNKNNTTAPITHLPPVQTVPAGQQVVIPASNAVNPSNALSSLINTVTKAINPPATQTITIPPIQTSTSQAEANSEAVQQSVDNLFSTVPSLTPANPTGSIFNPVPITLTDPNSFIQPATSLADNTSVQSDAQYLMFENGDYPGASMGKVMARLGEY